MASSGVGVSDGRSFGPARRCEQRPGRMPSVSAISNMAIVFHLIIIASAVESLSDQGEPRIKPRSMHFRQIA